MTLQAVNLNKGKDYAGKLFGELRASEAPPVLG